MCAMSGTWDSEGCLVDEGKTHQNLYTFMPKRHRTNAWDRKRREGIRGRQSTAQPKGVYCVPGIGGKDPDIKPKADTPQRDGGV